MMGAGKSSIGRRLAVRLGVDFRDADNEIEAAAGQPIAAIFAAYGEAAFRDCEKKVISRLLDEPPHVLATGGGAFMAAETRERIREKGFSIWMRAPVELLLARVSRKNNRPLLADGDPRETLGRLLALRGPTYAEADVIFDSEDGPHAEAVEKLVVLLTERGLWSP